MKSRSLKAGARFKTKKYKGKTGQMEKVKKYKWFINLRGET